MGLNSKIVKLEKYNYNWPNDFKEESNVLKELIGEYLLDIEHIGSTAIKDLKAKPIIDIAIAVKKLSDVSNFVDILKDNKYEIGHNNINKEEYLVIKGTKENTTHIIHILEFNGDRWNNCLLFKKYLNNHSDIKLEYEILKEKLSLKYFADRKTYTLKKSSFIMKVIELAKNEQSSINKV